jgi:Domain of unknown function (DUF4145)
MLGFQPPTPDSTSFNCPRCGALAQQFWYELLATQMDKDSHPTWFREDLKQFLNGPDAPHDWPSDEKEKFLVMAERVNAEDVFFHGNQNPYNPPQIKNLHVSRCYRCDDLSVWIGRKLAYPETSTEFQASADMPDMVRRDFVEAAAIFGRSPRAAAALLRVAIEKLCNEINGKQLSIFNGIGELVKKGLDEKIQKALDIVRVTGNDAVHPGQIDFNDTPQDAERLFKLVNLIVDKLITIPKEIDAVYDGIPEEKRKAIEQRDSKKPAP